jgi:hypothetical protein
MRPIAIALLLLCGHVIQSAPTRPPIQHVVVLMMENRCVRASEPVTLMGVWVLFGSLCPHCVLAGHLTTCWV